MDSKPLPSPKPVVREDLGESWVDLSGQSGAITPPLLNCEEYLRLLKEAQRESNQSSARVSLASSRRNSPKSPPNSPCTELYSDVGEIREVNIIDGYGKSLVPVTEKVASDWVWDWSSRPEVDPPKEWNFKHPRKPKYSFRKAKVGNYSLFSKRVLYTLLFTNILSLLIGTGLGMWLRKFEIKLHSQSLTLRPI